MTFTGALDFLRLDLRYAARALRRQPIFAGVAVATLALGIGASTAVFSVVEAALLRPLPYADPESLVDLRDTGPVGEHPSSYPDLLDWRSQARSFTDLAGFSAGLSGFLRDAAGQSFEVGVGRASASLFPLLGARPELGRNFNDSDELPGAERAVILSHGLWASRFGSDATLVGRTVDLNGVPRRVVGVLPASFRFYSEGGADTWVSFRLSPDQRDRRNYWWMNVLGRLRPGVPIAQAQAEMRTLAAALAAAHPDSNAKLGVVVTPLRERLVGDARPVLLTLFAAVLGVLSIACANVAGLLAARAAGRRRELGVRVALGAGRARLVRQTLAETLLLAGLGGGLGWLLSGWGVRLAVAAIPTGAAMRWPYLQELHPNLAVAGFALLVSLVAALVFGVVPALAAAKRPAHEALRAGSRGSAGTEQRRLRAGLVVAELALAVGVLSAAGLLLRSSAALLGTDPGFAVERVLTAQVSLLSREMSPSQTAVFQRLLLERVGALPGVTGVATVDAVPLSGDNSSAMFAVEGRPEAKPGEVPEADVRTVSPSYFSTLGIALQQGPGFDPADQHLGPSKVIVNATLARRFFPGENPVGKRIKFTFDDKQPWQEIVGVMADQRLQRLDEPPRLTIYSSSLQEPSSDLRLLVRCAGNAAALRGPLEAAVHAVDRDAIVSGVATLERVSMDSEASFSRRYPALLLSVFAGVALFMAALGLYGVVAYSVTQRRREIGVRMALGAVRRDVVRLVLGEGAGLVAAGLALGGLIAAGSGRLVKGLLYQVAPFDPLTLTLVATVLALVGLVACWVPARRAASVDPGRTLRED